MRTATAPPAALKRPVSLGSPDLSEARILQYNTQSTSGWTGLAQGRYLHPSLKGPTGTDSWRLISQTLVETRTACLQEQCPLPARIKVTQTDRSLPPVLRHGGRCILEGRSWVDFQDKATLPGLKIPSLDESSHEGYFWPIWYEAVLPCDPWFISAFAASLWDS